MLYMIFYTFDIFKNNKNNNNKNKTITNNQDGKEVLDPKTSTLWWAGKELKKDKKLSDYLGRNEKTKIIAKLQKAGQGAPVREAPLTEQEQKNLMAYYYKKQEEQKVYYYIIKKKLTY